MSRPAPREEPAAAVPAAIVEVIDVWKSFDGNEVLRGISMDVPRGETLVVMGGSGSGKTVLLRSIAGLLRPDRGRIRVFGRYIERLSEEELLPIRRRMGYVFQGAALFDSLSVYENVAYPLREHTRLAEPAIRERVLETLGRVGLNGDVLPLLPSEISGGMRKRVGIASALMVEPEILLFDEPTAGLDPTNSRLVAELIGELHAGMCDTAIVVTHDLELTRAIAVETPRGRIDAGAIVDAAGAWAGLLAREAGGAPPRFEPRRRHLFLSRPIGGAAEAPPLPGSPFVWDIDRGWYARPEGPRWLLSPCDEEPHPPGAPDVSAGAVEALERKLCAHAPALAQTALPAERGWACLRTFAPDGRFAIGPDPAIENYFYAAGLGGHGVTTAPAFGELAAAAVLDPGAAPPVFRADRFARSARPTR